MQVRISIHILGKEMSLGSTEPNANTLAPPLPIGRGAAGVGLAAAAFAGAGAWAVQHFRKGPNDVESAARKEEQDMKATFENWMKEEDMSARFENWIKEYNKTYRDEEEKAMRFQVFKDTVKSIESLPPSTHKKFLPPNGFADLTSEELPCIQPCIDDDLDDPDSEEYRQNKFLAENENAAHKKEEEMKELNKTYRDEEEKAMRFQLPSVQGYRQVDRIEAPIYPGEVAST